MSKSVKDAMTANPFTVNAEQTVAYAAKVMRDEDVGVAPVVDEARLVGTLTDRDIVVRVIAEGRDPQAVKVRDVASTELITVGPQQDLDEALELMANHQVRRLPVVEEDGVVVGVLTQADVAEEAKPKKVGELVEEISKH